jgi:hypothetical protein
MLFIKIDRPTRMCSDWLADLVELVSGLVASGNAATRMARTEAAAGTVAAGMVGGDWAWPAAQSVAQTNAQYVPLQQEPIPSNLRASLKTIDHLLIAQDGLHLVWPGLGMS